MIVSQRITIVRMSKPARKNINEELQWFGSSLGLFGLRDKDKSLFRLFIELLKAAKMKKTISSDELAERTNLSRGTVVHHISKLIQSGIVIHSENRYVMRVDRLEDLVKEIQRDINQTCSELKEIARDIDEWIGV